MATNSEKTATLSRITYYPSFMGPAASQWMALDNKTKRVVAQSQDASKETILAALAEQGYKVTTVINDWN